VPFVKEDFYIKHHMYHSLYLCINIIRFIDPYTLIAIIRWLINQTYTRRMFTTCY